MTHFLMTVSFFSMLNSVMRIDLQGLFSLTPSLFVIEKMSFLENMSEAMGKNCFVTNMTVTVFVHKDMDAWVTSPAGF